MKTTVRGRRVSRTTRPNWRKRPVTEHRIIRTGLGESLYYLCPGCRVFLPREYMRFCDSCGQRLGWESITDADPDEYSC